MSVSPTPRRDIFEPWRLEENRIYGVEAEGRQSDSALCSPGYNPRLHLRQPAAASAANLQQNSLNGCGNALAPQLNTPGRSVRSVQWEDGNFTIGFDREMGNLFVREPTYFAGLRKAGVPEE